MVEIPSAYRGISSVNDFIVVWRIHHDTDGCYFCVGFSVCLVLVLCLTVHFMFGSPIKGHGEAYWSPFSSIFVCLGEFIIVDGVDLLNCRGALPFINQLT